MPALNIYTDDETYKQVKGLERGEASKIFNEALKEHLGATDNLDKVNRRLDNLYQEKAELDAKIKFLEKRKKQLEKQQREIEESKKRLEKEKESKHQEKLKTLNETFNEELGRDISQDELDKYQKGDYSTIWHFIDEIKQNNQKMVNVQQ